MVSVAKHRNKKKPSHGQSDDKGGGGRGKQEGELPHLAKSSAPLELGSKILPLSTARTCDKQVGRWGSH